VGEPEVLPTLTAPQAEVLAICVGIGLVTRSRIESIRGVDTADVLAVLVRRGLLECEPDDDSVGRPLVYRPTAKLLHISNVETLEDLRVSMGLPPDGVLGSGIRP
jgi:chromosome segregation and condensation protein ScpB